MFVDTKYVIFFENVLPPLNKILNPPLGRGDIGREFVSITGVFLGEVRLPVSSTTSREIETEPRVEKG